MKRGSVLVFIFLLVAFPSSGASENGGSISGVAPDSVSHQRWDESIVIQPIQRQVVCAGKPVDAVGAVAYSVDVNGKRILSGVSGRHDITKIVHDLVAQFPDGRLYARITIVVEDVQGVELPEGCHTTDTRPLKGEVSRLVIFCDGDCEKPRNKELGC